MSFSPGVLIGSAKATAYGLVLGFHRARRQHDDLISVGRDGGVDLGAAHHDAIGALLDHAHIIVGMVLRGGSERAIALDVGLRHRDREIVVAAIAMILRDPLAVLGLASGRHPLAHDMQCVERVGADLLDQHDQGRALAGRGRDKFAALEQVIGVARQMEVAAVLAAGIAHHGKPAVLRIFGHPVVDTGVFDCDSDHGIFGDVGDFLAAQINRSPVAQRFLVLLRCSQSHRDSPALLISRRRRRAHRGARLGQLRQANIGVPRRLRPTQARRLRRTRHRAHRDGGLARAA